jgi:hypothetical protein
LGGLWTGSQAQVLNDFLSSYVLDQSLTLMYPSYRSFKHKILHSSSE